MWFKTQELILGTGTAIWWVTEPHSRSLPLEWNPRLEKCLTVTNTLAYYGTELITPVKSFIAQGPETRKKFRKQRKSEIQP